jgi:predicted nuclease with TOPRIM domain
MAVVMDCVESSQSGEGRRFRSPLRVVARFLERSRDLWKRKYMELKAELHRLKVRVQDMDKSRRQWRERAETSEAKVAELHAELQRLQAWLSEPPDAEVKTQTTVARRRAPR